MQYFKKHYRQRKSEYRITLHILAEYLENAGYTVAGLPADDQGWFLWRHEEEASESFKSGIGIYRLKELLAGYVNEDDEHLILLLDSNERCSLGELTEMGSKSPAERLMILVSQEDNEGVSRLEAEIKSFFSFIDCLIARYEEALADDDAFQTLVDVAEECFGSFIAITDAANMLIAYSKNIAPNNDVDKSLIENGHHTDFILEREDSEGYQGAWIDKQRAVSVFEHTGDGDDIRLTWTMHVDGQIAGNVYMTIAKNEVTQGTIDVFELFSRYCERAARFQWQALSIFDSSTQFFLARLLRDRNLDPFFSIEQSEKYGIPMSGHFIIAHIDVEKEYSNQLFNAANLLKDELKFASNVIVNENTIVMILSENSDDELACDVAELVDCKRRHSRFIRRVYLSDMFNKLSSAFFANRQIEAIKKYEQKIGIYKNLGINSSEPPACMTPLDAFSFFVEDSSRDTEIGKFVFSKAIGARVYKNDLLRDTDDLVLLFTYLIYNRKAAIVARLFHLHRNGVVYRIEKICRLYSLDLNDYLTRQSIETSIRMMLSSSDSFMRYFINRFNELGIDFEFDIQSPDSSRGYTSS